MKAGMVTGMAGTVVELCERGDAEPRSVRVHCDNRPEARYERLLAQVLRLGRWLESPDALLLDSERWEECFAEHQRNLAELRRLGDELRPVSLRHRSEPLAGEALVAEVAELFAA